MMTLREAYHFGFDSGKQGNELEILPLWNAAIRSSYIKGWEEGHDQFKAMLALESMAEVPTYRVPRWWAIYLAIALIAAAVLIARHFFVA